MTWTHCPTEKRDPEAKHQAQVPSGEPEGGVRTFCWQRPAGPGGKPCVALPHPWGALWGVLHAPPQCTPDTWRSHRTGSKSPSPVGNTRTIPGSGSRTEGLLCPWPWLAISHLILTASPGCRKYYVQFHRKKRKEKLLCARPQTDGLDSKAATRATKPAFLWLLD